MRKSLLILVSLLLVTAFAASPGLAAVTYWDPLVGYKMHYPQLPDTTTNGLDVNCNTNSLLCCDCGLADDWQCSETGNVKSIHFWGSWKDDAVGVIDTFELSIYSNVPGSPSMPGTLLWTYHVPYSYVHVHAASTSVPKEGWYNPCPGCVLYAPANHRQYYQYNVTLPNPNLFHQQQGTIYWLGIRAQLHASSPGCWGWKTSMSAQFMDDAVYRCSGGPWLELKHPVGQASLDLAFVITGDPYGWPSTPSLTEVGILILLLSLAVVGAVLIWRARRARLA